MPRQPIVTGFPGVRPTWRHIGGLDFQQVRPYVLVAQPDRARPHMTVWLRKLTPRGEAALWSAKVVRGDTPLSEVRGHSAAGAVAAALTDRTLTGEPPIPHPAGRVTRDPYPENYWRAPAGWYPDRPTAHDVRWSA